MLLYNRDLLDSEIEAVCDHLAVRYGMVFGAVPAPVIVG